MTAAEFTAFYPQFAGFTPAVVMTEYIRQANARFSGFTPEDAEEARRLYTAHKLTMYARVALPDGAQPSKAAIAAAGQAQQKIASKKVGEVSVTYSTGTSSSSVSKWWMESMSIKMISTENKTFSYCCISIIKNCKVFLQFSIF